MTADAWVRFTTRGTLHFLGAGDRTTPCGVPAREPVERLTPAESRELDMFEQNKACPVCRRAARWGGA